MTTQVFRHSEEGAPPLPPLKSKGPHRFEEPGVGNGRDSDDAVTSVSLEILRLSRQKNSPHHPHTYPSIDRWKICGVVPIFVHEQELKTAEVFEAFHSRQIGSLLCRGAELRAISTWNALAIIAALPTAAVVNCLAKPIFCTCGALGMGFVSICEGPDKDYKEATDRALICCELSKRSWSAAFFQFSLSTYKAACLVQSMLLPEMMVGYDTKFILQNLIFLNVDLHLEDPPNGCIECFLTTIGGRSRFHPAKIHRPTVEQMTRG